jgi:hypothetical protein
MIKKEAIFPLKEEIKRNETESKALNRSIQATSGPARHALRLEKRSLGTRTRYLLLTYALLRGRPYTSLERKCAEGCRPWPSVVQERSFAYDPSLSLDSVKDWLEGPKEAEKAA